MSCRCPSVHRGCCPAWAAGRLPGAGHGVRGAAAHLHPMHPRTPRFSVTRKLFLGLGCPPSAACRMGHRREPSPACGRGDVRACCGAPSALRASGAPLRPQHAASAARGGMGDLAGRQWRRKARGQESCFSSGSWGAAVTRSTSGAGVFPSHGGMKWLPSQGV